MGRDIHVVLEKKTVGGWAFFDPDFDAFDNRYYVFFDYLDGISDPGCPPELKGKKLRSYTEKWDDQDGRTHEEGFVVWDTTERSDLYGFGYITLEKLAYETKRLNTLWVSADFLEKFHLLGGRLPEEMQVAMETFGDNNDAVGVRVVDEDDLHLRDYLNAKLKQIAKAHHLQDSELRICYAFDC